MKNDSVTNKYRHEYKYLCDGMQNAVLKMRAKGILKIDSHVMQTGYYRVRSLYFDTWEDKCFYENENGIGERDKYRLRIYNGDKSVIVLEKKSKSRQMTLKQSCRITEDLCRQLMSGKICSTCDMCGIQQQLVWEMKEKVMKPAVIVEYVRYPFVDGNGNVRVTFDEMISSSSNIYDFLEKKISVRPIMEKGMSVLEVKWDEFLPTYIKNHLQLDDLQWSNLSKFYLCRKYNVYGGIRV